MTSGFEGDYNMGSTAELDRINLKPRLIYANGKFRGDLEPPRPDVSERVAQNLLAHTYPLAPELLKTADCMDKRKLAHMANGEKRQDVLRNRIVLQGPGGRGVYATKGLVTANIGFLRDAPDFIAAHQLIVETQAEQGFVDAGHIDCKAIHNIRRSAEFPLTPLDAHEFTAAITHGNNPQLGYFEDVDKINQQLIKDKFYSGSTPSHFESLLEEDYPENYATLSDDVPTISDEHPPLLYIVPEGYGFDRNGFAETGDLAYAFTPQLARELAYDFTGPAEERSRAEAGLFYDFARVVNLVAAEGMQVYAPQAA